MMRNNLLAGLALGLFAMSGAATAQSVTFGTPSPASGPAGTAFTVPVTFTAGGGTAAYQVDVQIPPQFENVTSTNTDGVCAIGNPQAGAFRVSDFDAGLAALPSGTVCTLAVNIVAGTANGTYNFSTCTTGACQAPLASDGGGAPVATFTVAYGSGFTVAPAAVPTPPGITGVYVPRAGASGQIGATVAVGDLNFTVNTPAANGGTGSVVCTDAVGGPVFTINPASQTGLTTTVADPVVSCPLTAAAQTGDVSCVINGGAPQTFAGITCPAGAALPPPVATPAIIPTNSLWSKVGLIGLLAALGMLMVGFRRQQ